MSKRDRLPDLEPPEMPQEERWITSGQMLVLVGMAGLVCWAYLIGWLI